jgi:hypothetical protein
MITLLDSNEARELTGLGKAAIWHAMLRGKLTRVQINGRSFVIAEELREYMIRRRQQPPTLAELHP